MVSGQSKFEIGSGTATVVVDTRAFRNAIKVASRNDNVVAVTFLGLGNNIESVYSGMFCSVGCENGFCSKLTERTKIQ